MDLDVIEIKDPQSRPLRVVQTSEQRLRTVHVLTGCLGVFLATPCQCLCLNCVLHRPVYVLQIDPTFNRFYSSTAPNVFSLVSASREEIVT